MLVQRESEKQFAILNQLESRFPIPAIRGSYPIKPASAREIHQRSISKRHIHRVKISATMIAFRIKIFLFPEYADWSLNRPNETTTTTLALQSSTKYLSSTYFFFLTWYSDALSTLENGLLFSRSFFFFFNSHSILICHKMNAMMNWKRKNHVENAYRRDQVTYLCGWWRCPIVRKSNWEMMDAWWYTTACINAYTYIKKQKTKIWRTNLKKKIIGIVANDSQFSFAYLGHL